MESVLNWSVIISIIGVLVVLTNIVVQVLKKVTCILCRNVDVEII